MSDAEHFAEREATLAVRFDAPSLAERTDAELLALLREVGKEKRPHGYMAVREYTVDEVRVVVREAIRLEHITQAARDE